MISSEPREPIAAPPGPPAAPGEAAPGPATAAPPATPGTPVDEVGWATTGAATGTIAGTTTGSAGAAAIDRQAALRALRNLEATEARLERNARREVEEARGKLVHDLLPVLDNLDRTIRAAHAGRGDPAMLEGVRMVRQQLEGVLRGYGVERIDALGERFDPAIHEAIGMSAVNDPRRHGAVVQQAEPGYRLAGRLLRPAKVSVGKLVEPPQVRAAPYWR